MRNFNDREKVILSRLISASSDESMDMSRLLESFFFTEQNGRALIIKSDSRYVVFFLRKKIFEDPNKKEEEIAHLFELISLINYLKTNEYISIDKDEKSKESKMIFIQDLFVDPVPSPGAIILNARGDYTSGPDTIRDQGNHVVYCGVTFQGNTFELILSIVTGILHISPSLRELFGDISQLSNAPEQKNNISQSSSVPEPPNSILESSSVLESKNIPHIPEQSGISQDGLKEIRNNKKQLSNKINLLLSVSIIFLLLVLLRFVHLNGRKYERDLKSLIVDYNDLKTTFWDMSLKIQKLDTTFLSQNISLNPVQHTKSNHYGIDISKWNWNLVESVNITDTLSFMICKATEGVSMVDINFIPNWKMIKEKRLMRGAYHSYQTNVNPIEQAEFFLSKISEVDSADVAPIVNIEAQSLHTKTDVDKVNVQIDLFLFLKHIKLRSERLPIIYSNRTFANEYLTHQGFAEYPLWLSEYTSQSISGIPKIWKELRR